MVSINRCFFLPSYSVAFLVLWQISTNCQCFPFVASRKSKIHKMATYLNFFFFFVNLLITSMFGLLASIRWSISISKLQQILCISFSWMGSSLYIYYLVIWSNFNRLHYSQWINHPSQSCLVLHFFCTILLHYVINRFISVTCHYYNYNHCFCTL